MGQIRFNVVKKVRKWALSIYKLFSYFSWGIYLLKEKVDVIQTPEWKFKANIAEMPQGPNFCPIPVKNGK